MSDVFGGSQAEGAIPNGTRIRKKISEPGDAHNVGAEGVVVSSAGPLPAGPQVEKNMIGEYGYIVHWDDNARLPVFVAGFKIEALE